MDIKKKVADALKDQVVRKSVLDTESTKTTGAFSITKYIKGASGRGWNDADYEKMRFEETNKALTESTSTAGGFLVAPEYSAQLIELLQAQSVIRSMGPTVLPLNSDQINIPRQTGASTAYWVAEEDTITESALTLGDLKLVLKNVAGIVRASNFLINDASPAIEALVRNDLVRKLALAEDLAFMFGTGGAQPLGIALDPDVGSTTLGSPNGATPTVDDLYDAMYAIEAENATYTAWLMHPRTKNSLRKLKDANGQYIWQQGNITTGEPDSLLGLPVRLSTQISITTTCGTNTDCSYIFLADWREYMIAERANEGLVMAVSDEEGTSFAKNLSAIRGVMRVDGGCRQPNAFYVIKGVRP